MKSFIIILSLLFITPVQSMPVTVIFSGEVPKKTCQYNQQLTLQEQKSFISEQCKQLLNKPIIYKKLSLINSDIKNQKTLVIEYQ